MMKAITSWEEKKSDTLFADASKRLEKALEYVLITGVFEVMNTILPKFD